MRITFLTQWFHPEPAATRGLPLAAALHARGHEIEVVTGFPNYPGGQLYPGYRMRTVQREDHGGVNVIRVPLYPSHDRSALRRLGNYTSFALSSATIGLALARPSDVLYVYHPPATVGVGAELWKRLRATPFVLHIADMWPDSVTESGMVSSRRVRRSMEVALSWWCRRLYRSAAAITVLSPGFKRLLVERGVSDHKVEVIYNWADDSTFFPFDASRSESSLGPPGTFTILYAGNLGRYQCLDAAIRAAHMLSSLPGFQLALMGTGQAEPALRALASELGTRNVRFLPRRDESEMNGILNQADALLVSLMDLPFFSATIPSKTQVALATGRPVIVAAKGDAADLVQQAGGGLVCTPGDSHDMAAVFAQMYRMSPADRAALGASGRGYYLCNLSLENGAARMESLFGQIAAVRHRSSVVGSGSGEANQV